MADHLGAAYLRYSFTKGTAQEATFLLDVLGLQPGARSVDVGCGPGRHAHAFAAAGVQVIGIDISEVFVGLAAADGAAGAAFAVGDARALPVASGSCDAVISLCQGGFGLLGGVGEHAALHEMARVLAPGGRLAVSAFSSYFQVRWLEHGDSFDADTGVNHERTTVLDPAGRAAEVDLWTTCFTPRELRLMAAASGLEVEGIWGVAPGAYGRRPPSLEHPEHLLVARKPLSG